MYNGEVVECGSIVDVLVLLLYDLIWCLIVGYFGEVFIVDVWCKDGKQLVGNGRGGFYVVFVIQVEGKRFCVGSDWWLKWCSVQ